jgi:hypothetical protein
MKYEPSTSLFCAPIFLLLSGASICRCERRKINAQEWLVLMKYRTKRKPLPQSTFLGGEGDQMNYVNTYF